MADGPDPVLEGLVCYVVAPAVIILTVIYLAYEVITGLNDKQPNAPSSAVQREQHHSLSYKAGYHAKHITFDFVKGFFSR